MGCLCSSSALLDGDCGHRVLDDRSLIAPKTLFEVFFDPIAFLSKKLPGKAAASGSGSA
jgi:hypothetical protein